MKSARGIYYDIKESDYYIELNINGENYVLYFSSMFLLKKFKENIISFIHDENIKLSCNYKIDIDATKLIILYYYMKVEKRGFRVLINGNEILLNNLTLVIR